MIVAVLPVPKKGRQIQKDSVLLAALRQISGQEAEQKIAKGNIRQQGQYHTDNSAHKVQGGQQHTDDADCDGKKHQKGIEFVITVSSVHEAYKPRAELLKKTAKHILTYNQSQF